jgi:FAD/FMN-containing dehydrogenase
MIRLLLLFAAGCASTPIHLCKPSEPCWPSEAEWQSLASRLTGKLLQPKAAPPANDPFTVEGDPAGTQSVGWLGAWDAAVSARAVAAETSADVAAAVTFARLHHLKVVIKGTGHDYLGRSNALDSLLIWTHPMRHITMHDRFVPSGCSDGTNAVSIEAGARWLEAYQEVTVRHGRYVQGGGCTSVGAAGGFILGGGFGSWSKKYGSGAASLLEAEVVTADGQVRIANSCQNQDLFWALRGGGGGTFGVVTRMTLATHALPKFFGFVGGRITAESDDSFRQLLERFVDFYGKSLGNEHWGEQVTVKSDNRLEISMLSSGLSGPEMEAVWQPFLDELKRDHFQVQLRFGELPADKMWNREFLSQMLPGLVVPVGDLYFWASNRGELGTYWHAYQSRWLPAELFTQPKRLAAALFAASRHWGLELHFNKGQAGASADAVERGRKTSMNPAVFRAAALLIASATGHSAEDSNGAQERAQVSAAMKIIRELTPGAGSYLNETDWFEPDWQSAFWGENYPRLLQIKRKYDPGNLFSCHHCVGSE